MVPKVTAILQRFTTEWAALLQPEAILAACVEVGYLAWRDRVLIPVTTIQLFLLQILHGNTACSHPPHLSSWRFSAAYAIQPAPNFCYALSSSSLSASQRGGSDPPWTKGCARAIAPFSSMARAAPCLIRRPPRRPSASHRGSGRGAAPSLWPGSWGCSMWALGCSSSWPLRPSSPMISPRYSRCTLC
jgi:hypothetical protein